MNKVILTQYKRAFDIKWYAVTKEKKEKYKIGSFEYDCKKITSIYSGFSYAKAMRAGHAARNKNYPLFEIITKPMERNI